MPAKRTMRFLAARSGTTFLCAARSWALVGFQGVGNIRFIGRRPWRVFCRQSEVSPCAPNEHAIAHNKVMVVRGIPTHFILFEKLINLVHEHAPHARFCFNTKPSDTAEAVRHWI